MNYPNLLVTVNTNRMDRWIYNVRFNLSLNVEVTITEHGSVIAQWLGETQAATRSVMGIVVQGGEEHPARADILTLAWENRVLMIRLRANRCYLGEPLYDLLENRNRSFVGLDITPIQRASLLLANPRLIIGRLANIRDTVYNGSSMPPAYFAGLVLGNIIGINFDILHSDWRPDELTNDQIRYTAMQAYVNAAIATQNQAAYLTMATQIVTHGGNAANVAAYERRLNAIQALETMTTAVAMENLNLQNP